MSQTFEFACPYCSQSFAVGSNYFGIEFPCPHCNSPLLIEPETAVLDRAPSGMNAQMPATPRNSPGFSAEELALLSGEDPQLREAVAAAAKQNCWECWLIAQLLTYRLEPLRLSVFDTTRKLATNRVWPSSKSKLHKRIDGDMHAFFDIVDRLYLLMTEHLYRAMVLEDVSTIVDFTNLCSREFAELGEFRDTFYSQSFPADGIYSEIQQIINGWVPYCWQACSHLVYYLNRHCTERRQLLPRMRPQIALMPPTMHRFYMLLQQIS